MLSVLHPVLDAVHERRHQEAAAPALGERVIRQFRVNAAGDELPTVIDADLENVVNPAPAQSHPRIGNAVAAVLDRVVNRLDHGQLHLAANFRFDSLGEAKREQSRHHRGDKLENGREFDAEILFGSRRLRRRGDGWRFYFDHAIFHKFRATNLRERESACNA